MQLVQPVRSYLEHLVHSSNQHGVHSPFVYDLVTQVIRSNEHGAETKAIEVLRARLKRDKREIAVNDLGAGSRVHKSASRSIKSIVISASLSKKDGEFLYRCVRYFKAENILELGTNLGLGTAYMALAANGNAKVNTIEGCEALMAQAQTNFKELGLENIIPYVGSFQERMPEVLKKMGRVDLLVIDGDHRYEPTLDYLKMALPYLHGNSLVLLDDIHWSEGMEKAWQEIQEMPEFNVTIDLYHVGLAFKRPNQAKEHFRIRR